MCKDNSYLKKTLVFNSANKIAGTTSNYTVKFNDRLHIVRSIKLLSVQLPNTIYNIDSTNNTLVINDGIGDYIIQIGAGAYTTATLEAALVAGLTAAYANAWAVEFDTTTFLTTITGTAAFTLVLSESTINSVLGFGSTDTASATSHTSTSAWNLGVPTPIFICIDEVGRNVMYTDNYCYTFVVQITENSQEFVNYRVHTDMTQKHQLELYNLQNYTVSLRKQNNVLVDLNGLDWNFVVEVEYEL